MIKSFEIQFPLSVYDLSYCIFRLNYPRQKLGSFIQYRTKIWNKDIIDAFFKQPKDKDYNIIIDDDIHQRYKGILKIIFLHSYTKDIDRDLYFIRMKIDPCALLQKKYSEDLLYCSSDNISALQEAYSKTIFNLFPMAYVEPIPLNYDDCLNTDQYTINMGTGEIIYYSELLEKHRRLAALPYLGLATVKRIDYATNLRLPDNFQYFLTLAKRSILDKRKITYFSKDKSKLELKNKHSIFAVYDRIKISNGCYASQGIIQFKVIIRNPSKEWKKSNLRIDTEKDDNNEFSNLCGGVLPFLNEEIANNIINKAFDKLVGPGDFYSTYRAWKKIDESKFKRDKKQNLKELMQLISQCWSLQKAEKQYIKGVPLKKSRKIVKGTLQTFRKSVQQLRELGVQPLRIPDSWHLSYLHNPIADDVNSKILFGPVSLRLLLSKESFQKYEETKAEIERLLKVRKFENQQPLELQPNGKGADCKQQSRKES